LRCHRPTETSFPMHTHANARLTQKGRLRLVSHHLNDHRPLAELASEAGISLRCAYKWLARYRSGGPASLADRRSVRHTQRRTLDPQHLQRAVELSHQRLHLRHIARLLAAPFSTVARALNRLGAGPAARPRTQASCSALRTGTARRPDPHRRQKAGPLSAGRSPHHRKPVTRPLHRRWLRSRSRHHRRHHAAGLRRDAAR